MQQQKLLIHDIPAILYGKPSDRAYLYVHGKMAFKECAKGFTAIAEERGYQVLSFDLPGHGERKEHAERCDVWNGMRDLKLIAEYAQADFRSLSLFACSLGAYFSLNTYRDVPFEKCLFQSPVVDMPYLIGQMFVWFGVTPERLEREGEIETPVDTMSWRYYQYALKHPTTDWPHPTHILYGALDDMQSREVITRFAEHNRCALTVSEHSKHPFMEDADAPVVREWMEKNA